MKTFKKLRKNINEEIEVGDIVKIIDGSGLCCEQYPEKDFYIVYAYSEVGDDLKHSKLENIDCVVLESGVRDYVSHQNNSISCYLLDVRIQCGNITFKTCSQFLRKI